MGGVRPVWSAPLFFLASGQLGPKINFTFLTIIFRFMLDIAKGIVYNKLTTSHEFGEVDFVKVYWIFLILAIVCALLSDKIDGMVNADKKLKKVIVVLSVGVLLVCTIAIIATTLS